ncbi:hypothetical protein NA57DRAFT_17871, partial [Rhizodiscina lignyota]
QLQIDLGQLMTRHCKTCGMSYIASNIEDAALHQKFHAQNLGGVDLGKSFLDSDAVRKNQVWYGESGSSVVECSRKSGTALRHRSSNVLELANLELGAVDIPEKELWGTVVQPSMSNGEQANVDRFKAYLYVRGGKCIGLCLVERISKAARVLAPESTSTSSVKPAQSSSILASEETDPVLLGVSRIWTSSSHRKEGIATRLLQCAQENFLYGIQVPKEQMAFSQPTESGGALARKWFGAQTGWHVY